MNKARSSMVRPATLFGCVLGVIGCDQASKAAARALLTHAHPLSYLGGALKLTLVFNSGAFLSLGSDLSRALRYAIFSVSGTLISLGALFYLYAHRNQSYRLLVAGSLAIGGALGNQIDRLLFQGAVTDFMVLALGPLHTGIFNLADLAATLGAAYYLLEATIWMKKRKAAPPLDPELRLT